MVGVGEIQAQQPTTDKIQSETPSREQACYNRIGGPAATGRIRHL
jgi:hypothetical protein